MKRLFLLLTTTSVMFLLASCTASEYSLSNEYIAETDYPYNFFSQTMNERIITSDKGYYMLNGDYLYYMDKKTNNPVLLDNRPDNECLETTNGENCNAYVSILNMESILFQLYQEQLYTIEYQYETKYIPTEYGVKLGEYELVRRDADGRNRKVLKKFPNASINEAGIHRGYLYYVVTDISKDSKLQYQLLRIPMNKLSKKPEVIYEGKYENGSISKMIPYGSQIYFYEWTDSSFFQIMRYDLDDSSTTLLWELKDDGFPQLEAINQNKLYFWYYHPSKTMDTADLFDERALKIYTSELDGSNIKETNIETAAIISNLYMDDSYTYVRPVWFQLTRTKDITDEIKIYKADELVHSVNMSHLPLDNSLYTGDDRYMFVRGNKDSVAFIQYLDKNEIESGTASFKTLIETPTFIGDTFSTNIDEP